MIAAGSAALTIAVLLWRRRRRERIRKQHGRPPESGWFT